MKQSRGKGRAPACHRVFLVALLLAVLETPQVSASDWRGGLPAQRGQGSPVHPRILHLGHHEETPSASSCSLSFQGETLSFSTCKQDPSGFVFRWNDKENDTVQLAVSLQHVGWIGFGIGTQMVGSSAVVAFPASGSGIAYVKQYYLEGKDESLVNPGEGNLQLGSDSLRAEFADGNVTMMFDLTLPEGQYPVADVIFASGPLGDANTGRIPRHTSHYRGTINWESGAESEPEGVSLTQVHGSLQVLIWTIIFPAGIFAARYFRHMDPLWWNLHRGIQGAGFILFVIAWLLGWMSEAKREKGMGTHLAFAFLLPVAVVSQVLGGILRPKKDGEKRPVWNRYHHWVGRSALFLAVINIYVGLYLYSAKSNAVALYTVLWLLVLLVFVGMEVYWRVRGPWSERYARLAVPTEVDMQSLNGEQREGFLRL